MLKPAPAKVNPTCPPWHHRWLWGECGPTWGKDQRTIWLLFGGAALLIWLFHLDTPLAHLAYHPNLSPEAQSVATFLRRNGTLPGTIFAVLALLLLFWPKLWATRPLLYRTAMVVVLTAVFGVGLTNQLIVKKLADRPRPQESVLIGSTTFTDSFRGNSMPSGHAAMGFILAAPFFPLRRRKPKLAATFLATGIVTGSVVGISRMMLGAHFATDVLVAGAITLASASLFTLLAMRLTRIPHRYIALGLLIGALSVILGNKFNHLTLTLPLTEPAHTFNLPCTPTATPTPVAIERPTEAPSARHEAKGGAATPLLTVWLSGYGAPLSLLKLENNQGIVSIRRHFGLYHNLTCTAIIALPQN